MDILFVNNIFPLFAKADSGASVRSMRIINALTKLGHVDVVSFLDDEVSNLEQCDVVYSNYISEASASFYKSKMIRMMCHRYDISDIWPINEQKNEVVKKIINDKHYDLIVVRYMKMACECGLLEYADRLVIDIDDDPKAVARMFNPGKKWRHRLFWHYVYANCVAAVTDRIVEKVHAAFNSQPEKHYPNTTYLPNISNYADALPDVEFSTTPPNILFVGRMDHKPNVESLEYFITKIFPILLQSHPSATLRVVGNIKDPKLSQICRSTPNVILCGFVENLLNEYKQSRCVVVPLLSGTGTSVKLIEAMSLNRAVVTTSKGCRGLNKNFIQGEDYLLADDINQFVECVSALLDNESLNHKISNNAKRKVAKYYSEDSFNAIIREKILSRYEC